MWIEGIVKYIFLATAKDLVVRNFLGAFKEASLTRLHLLALPLKKGTVKLKLSKLEKGRRAIIESVDLEDDLKKRFSSMGLSRGVVLRVCRRTFGSDSLHVKLECAACIALSKSEAQHIEVTPIGKGGGRGYCRRGRFEGKEYCCQRDDCIMKD